MIIEKNINKGGNAPLINYRFKLLKSEGASDKLIMLVAKKKNIPDKIVKEILV